jgi:hypothetical protein
MSDPLRPTPHALLDDCEVADTAQRDDAVMLDRIQRAAFSYFYQTCNLANGLVADNTRENVPCSIAVVGFALSAYPVGVERQWMTRTDAILRTLAALRFFHDSDQSGATDGTGWKGFYYHFLDMQSGTRVWFSELSLIDTALLIAGVLIARAYFSKDTESEREIRSLADALYLRVDWRWAQNGGAAVMHGWRPESGFLNYGWEGYSEAHILYTLGLGSPTHPLTAESYDAWTLTYQWENLYGHDFLYAGPLFIHQFSHAWIDFRGIRDRFMREKRCDYFENSRRATYVQREYARRNPGNFKEYGEDFWGLSANEGPVHAPLRINGSERRFFRYAARGVPYGPDDGTIAPSAPLASLPFAPEIALSATRNLLEQFPRVAPQGRFSSGFNPTLVDEDAEGWLSPGSFGLDQGLLVLTIENHRSGLPWRLMRSCEYMSVGLERAGFRGGWL